MIYILSKSPELACPFETHVDNNSRTKKEPICYQELIIKRPLWDFIPGKNNILDLVDFLVNFEYHYFKHGKLFGLP